MAGSSAPMGLAGRIEAQESQSQRTFVILNWVSGFAMAAFLYPLNQGAALRWLALHAVISAVPTVMMLRKVRPRVLGLVLPVALAISLCTIALFVPEGYSFWAIILAAICISISTRDSRAPLPVLAVALATVAYQYAFGPAAVVAEIRNGLPFNLFLTMVGFMVPSVGPRAWRRGRSSRWSEP